MKSVLSSTKAELNETVESIMMAEPEITTFAQMENLQMMFELVFMS